MLYYGTDVCCDSTRLSGLRMRNNCSNSQLRQKKNDQLVQMGTQVQQKDMQIQENEVELGRARTQLQQKNVKLNSIQQSLQVQMTFEIRISLSWL